MTDTRLHFVRTKILMLWFVDVSRGKNFLQLPLAVAREAKKFED